MDGGIPELYALSALAALAACGLLTRFVVGHGARVRKGLPTHLDGLPEALLAVAIALGLSGAGYLLSI